ncbi:hypothetical protein PoMZ_13553 [Pyricularia oryzae]|uniref:Uncharacterized protein n=1 Tax=Pyricularia oryzae TaxID=318829 RepID=A0A4P7NVL0_PYROR|nr:hypothetical protein PoMZ_13553 [Pyricularia oryzae]
MSFRVKDRENGVEGDKCHIKVSFEDSVVDQIIRTPFLKRSSTSNDNPTQTHDFVNHFQDSLLIEWDNTLSSLSRLREPVFTITNTPNKAVKRALKLNPQPELEHESGGETTSRLLRLTAHRHRNQPGRRAGHKTVPAVFINKKLVCQSYKQPKKWPTSTRKTSMPPAPDVAHNPSQVLSPTSSNTCIVPRKRVPPGSSRTTQLAPAHGNIANGSKSPWRGPKLHLQLRLEL